jgi:hypothetical protein
LGERVERVEQKVDDLATSVDRRFAEFSEALAEGRRYTESAFDRLEGRFDRLEGRFDGLEGRFGVLEGRFDALEGRFDALEGRFDGLEGRFGVLEGRFGRLERKLDQFIDVQSRANALVERRLNALESRPQS